MANKQSERQSTVGNGGELHQTTTSEYTLTTALLNDDEFRQIASIANVVTLYPAIDFANGLV